MAAHRRRQGGPGRERARSPGRGTRGGEAPGANRTDSMHNGSRPVRGPAAPCGAPCGADTAVTCMPQRRSALGRLVMTNETPTRAGRLSLPRKGWAAHRNRTEQVTHSGDGEGNTPSARSPERPIEWRGGCVVAARWRRGGGAVRVPLPVVEALAPPRPTSSAGSPGCPPSPGPPNAASPSSPAASSL